MGHRDQGPQEGHADLLRRVCWYVLGMSVHLCCVCFFWFFLVFFCFNVVRVCVFALVWVRVCVCVCMPLCMSSVMCVCASLWLMSFTRKRACSVRVCVRACVCVRHLPTRLLLLFLMFFTRTHIIRHRSSGLADELLPETDHTRRSAADRPGAARARPVPSRHARRAVCR